MASSSDPRRAADRTRRDPVGALVWGTLPFFLVIALPFAALVLFLDPREALTHLRSETAWRALLLTLRTTLAATVL
ncbi:MAG: hypothetical protein ACRDGR_10105, partial [bacterium]